MKKTIFGLFVVLFCINEAIECAMGMDNQKNRASVASFLKDKTGNIEELVEFCKRQSTLIESKIATAKSEGYCSDAFADKCDLALKYFKRFSKFKDEQELLNDLIKDTSNGFYDVSSFAINEASISGNLKEKAMLLLNEIWGLLWNMRETLDVKLASSKVSVALSDLLVDRLFSSVFLVQYIDDLDLFTESLWDNTCI